MTVTQRRTTAWTLVWLCVLVISYASLYPFDDWRNQDLAPWSFVGAPWPRYNTAFDIWSNLLGYMPLGFWLCLAAMRSGASDYLLKHRLARLAGTNGPAGRANSRQAQFAQRNGKARRRKSARSVARDLVGGRDWALLDRVHGASRLGLG